MMFKWMPVILGQYGLGDKKTRMKGPWNVPSFSACDDKPTDSISHESGSHRADGLAVARGSCGTQEVIA